MRSLSFLIVGGCTAALIMLAAGDTSVAQEKKDKGKAKAVSTVKVGDKAPAFASTDDQGKAFKSSDVVGKQTVALFFFPAALTGG